MAKPAAHPAVDRPSAVLDIDGVVADVNHRIHHLQTRPKNWIAFFRAAGADPVIAEGSELATLLAIEHEVVWLSGRPEWLRPVTERWLRDAALPAGPLWLRPDDDHRPAAVLKVSRLRQLARRHTIAAFVDDDPDVIRAARAAGFPTVLAEWSQRTSPAALHQAQRGGRT